MVLFEDEFSLSLSKLLIICKGSSLSSESFSLLNISLLAIFLLTLLFCFIFCSEIEQELISMDFSSLSSFCCFDSVFFLTLGLLKILTLLNYKF